MPNASSVYQRIANSLSLTKLANLCIRVYQFQGARFEKGYELVRFVNNTFYNTTSINVLDAEVFTSQERKNDRRLFYIYPTLLFSFTFVIPSILYRYTYPAQLAPWMQLTNLLIFLLCPVPYFWSYSLALKIYLMQNRLGLSIKETTINLYQGFSELQFRLVNHKGQSPLLQSFTNGDLSRLIELFFFNNYNKSDILNALNMPLERQIWMKKFSFYYYEDQRVIENNDQNRTFYQDMINVHKLINYAYRVVNYQPDERGLMRALRDLNLADQMALMITEYSRPEPPVLEGLNPELKYQSEILFSRGIQRRNQNLLSASEPMLSRDPEPFQIRIPIQLKID